MRSLKNNPSNYAGLLLFTIIAIFTLFFINPLQAAQASFQDSTKHGQMSHQMDKSKKTGMMGDMQRMHGKMMKMKMTGDPDYDFAQMMIEHHKGAIDMSKKEVNNGKDKQAISMAQEVIDEQNKDLKELQAYVKKNKPSKTDVSDAGVTGNTDEGEVTETGESKDMSESTTQGQEMTGSSDQSMRNKMMDMQQKMMNMEMKGDQDQDWVSMMIMHHQQAIDMSEDYLDKGKDESMKSLAQRTIDSNKEDIEKLRDWQSSHE